MIQKLYIGIRHSPAFRLAHRASVSFFAFSKSCTSLSFIDFFRCTSRVKLLLIDLYFLLLFDGGACKFCSFSCLRKTRNFVALFYFFFRFLFCFGADLHKLSKALTNIPTRYYCVLNVLRGNSNKRLTKLL